MNIDREYIADKLEQLERDAQIARENIAAAVFSVTLIVGIAMIAGCYFALFAATR